MTGVVIRQFQGPMAPGLRCQASRLSPRLLLLLQVLWPVPLPACCARHPQTFALPVPHCLLPLQVGLVLQATHLSVANERKGAVEVTPEAATLFAQFWQAHAGCPMLGRNKVGRSVRRRDAPGHWRLLRRPADAALLPPLLPPLTSTPQIVASVCPELHGLFNVKLATLLMLIGGVARCDDGGTHIRGELHMLLVGDPGTGERRGVATAAACCLWLLPWPEGLMQVQLQRPPTSSLKVPPSFPPTQARASSKSTWPASPRERSSPAAVRPRPLASPRPRCRTAAGGRWRRGRWCWRMAASAASMSLTGYRRRTGECAGG